MADMIIAARLRELRDKAGVTIAVDAWSGSPAIASATEIAPAVPPVGMAIFAPKETRKRARLWQFVSPRRVTMPEHSRWTIQREALTGVSVKITFCPFATVCRAALVYSAIFFSPFKSGGGA